MTDLSGPSVTEQSRSLFYPAVRMEMCMRNLLSTFFFEHFLITCAAYASLLLVILVVLWIKFAHLVELVAASVKRWTLGYLDFRDEVRRRLSDL
jgi:hypothetical protein